MVGFSLFYLKQTSTHTYNIQREMYATDSSLLLLHVDFLWKLISQPIEMNEAQEDDVSEGISSEADDWKGHTPSFTEL